MELTDFLRPEPSLGMTVRIDFVKLPRARCSVCRIRRVLYAIRTDLGVSPAKCAACAGIR